MTLPVQPSEHQKTVRTATAPQLAGHLLRTSGESFPLTRTLSAPQSVQHPILPHSLSATSAAASSTSLASKADPSQSRQLISVFFQPDPSHTQFNVFSDRLKQQKNWQEILTREVQTTPEIIQKLVAIPNDQLRGYDREALKVMLEAAKAATTDPKQLQALDDKLKHCDVLVVQVADDKMQYLGGGAVNAVFLVTYTDARGVERQGVFKPDPVDLPKFTRTKESLFGTAQASGIPSGSEGHLTERSVASSAVDKKLFPRENISVDTRYAVVNGQRGIMMAKAEGTSPKTGATVHEPITDKMVHDIPAAWTYYQKNKPLTTAHLPILAHLMNYRSIELKKGLIYGNRVELHQLNPNNPTTAEGLLRLQVFDWITGQVDRHPQNYFIADNGKVMGIDNDCSFGVNSVPERGDVRRQPTLMMVIPNNASLMLRMPPVVTQDVKNEIDALKKDQAGLVEDLSHYLTPKEVHATLVRLQKISAHVNSSNCLVVSNANDLLTEDAKVRMNRDNSYLMREIQIYNSKEENLNYMRRRA